MKNKYIFLVVISLLFLGGCAGKGFKLPTQSSNYDVRSISSDSEVIELKGEIQDFRSMITDEQGNRRNPSDISEYLDVGITVSDLACSVWFKIVSREGDSLDYKQRSMNILGDGLIGLLGLSSNVTNDLLGGLAITLGMGNAAFDNHNERFRLSNTMGTVYEKLKHARSNYSRDLLSRTQLSFPAAKRALRDYHNTCSRMSVEGFIEKSVELAKFELVDFSKDLNIKDIPNRSTGQADDANSTDTSDGKNTNGGTSVDTTTSDEPISIEKMLENAGVFAVSPDKRFLEEFKKQKQKQQQQVPNMGIIISN